MRKGEEFILASPIYVVLQPPHNYLGLHLGELRTLALFLRSPIIMQRSITPETSLSNFVAKLSHRAKISTFDRILDVEVHTRRSDQK